MSQDLPPGQGPINPGGAFTPPPPPGGRGPAPSGWTPPPVPPGGWGQGPQPMMPQPMPMMMYPPPYKQGRSLSKAILVTFATTIFTVSLGLNLWLGMLLFASGDGLKKRHSTLVEGDPMQTVVVIPLSGIIMGDAQKKFDRFLTTAEEDPNVKAVVIEIDSPGGDASASDQMYHRLLQFKEKKKIPVIVSMGGLACSGGYYVAMGGDHLFAQPTTLTGNIGVLAQRFNVSKLFDKWGIEEATLYSSGSDFKNAGSMFKPENPRDNAYIQGLIDEIFTQFKSVVSKGRAGKLKDNISKIANGKAYGAKDALALGLVDEIGYLENACAYAAGPKGAGLSKPHIVRYEEATGLAALLGANGVLGGFDASAAMVSVNGVDVKIDPAKLHELMAPRPMFLWRGE